jgi:uncharacterized membrane protein YfcA
MLTLILILAVVFFANFAQSVAGFGMAMIAMPLLIAMHVPLFVAAPLMALINLLSRIIQIVHYRRDIHLSDVWPLMLAAAIGIPVGVFVLQDFDPVIISRLLGLIVLTYAGMQIFNLYIPSMKHSVWAYGLGFASGLLGGAYKIGGPPVIIYATGRRWPSVIFKANIQVMAFSNAIFITLAQSAKGNVDENVLLIFLISIPLVLVGLGLAYLLEPHIQQAHFRRMVLGLLVLLGLRLLVG